MALPPSDKHDPEFGSPSSTVTSSKLETGPVDENGPAPNQVNWDNDTDPSNPMNWTPSLKWRNLGIISVMSFATYVLLHFVTSLYSLDHHLINH